MKKVLFIGLSLVDYDTYIVKELSTKYEVRYVNTIRFIKRYHLLVSVLTILFHSSSIVKWLCARTIMKDLRKFGNEEFDVVFTILGTFLNSKHVNYIKKHSPNAKYSMYLWDDWKRVGCPEKEYMRTQFTHIYSFDYPDCENYGFHFRPLFYVNNCVPSKNECSRVDVSFIGTNHSERFEWLKKIKKVCDLNNLSSKLILIVSRSEYFKLARTEKQEDLEILSTKEISYHTFLEITNNSACVVDFQHPSQRGLTMRTIEALSLGVKVITTNEYIKIHKDIPSDMYMVLNSNNVDEIPSFIKKESCSKLPEKYSLRFFLDEIIND